MLLDFSAVEDRAPTPQFDDSKPYDFVIVQMDPPEDHVTGKGVQCKKIKVTLECSQGDNPFSIKVFKDFYTTKGGMEFFKDLARCVALPTDSAYDSDAFMFRKGKVFLEKKPNMDGTPGKYRKVRNSGGFVPSKDKPESISSVAGDEIMF